MKVLFFLANTIRPASHGNEESLKKLSLENHFENHPHFCIGFPCDLQAWSCLQKRGDVSFTNILTLIMFGEKYKMKYIYVSLVKIE